MNDIYRCSVDSHYKNVHRSYFKLIQFLPENKSCYWYSISYLVFTSIMLLDCLIQRLLPFDAVLGLTHQHWLNIGTRIVQTHWKDWTIVGTHKIQCHRSRDLRDFPFLRSVYFLMCQIIAWTLIRETLNKKKETKYQNQSTKWEYKAQAKQDNHQ